MTLLSYKFTKIVVNDLDAAERFYTEALGFKVFSRTSAPGGEYGQETRSLSVSGSNDGSMLLLIRYLDRPAPAPGAAWIGLMVSDVDAAVAAAVKGGGKLLIPCETVEAHGARVGVVTDLEGHIIDFIQMLEPA